MKLFMNLINRSKSVITGKDNLEHLYAFKDFPIFMGCTDKPVNQDLKADMIWKICPESGVIQLTKLIPLDILYQEQHVDGTGERWQEYYRQFADYIFKYKPKNVLEVGGGQGALAENYLSQTDNSIWTMVDPSPIYKGDNPRIKIIKDFFGKDFKDEGRHDAVVMSQVMEHIYFPEEFLKDVYDYLEIGGYLFIAYPNLKLMLENKFTNAINFEHSIFLTDYHLDYLIKKVGFKIIDKTAYIDHSHFYALQKTEQSDDNIVLENKYDEYKKIFNDYISYHEEMVADLNKKIEEAVKPVYLFGAHIFSQYLISFGLKTDKIVNILDNSPLKQERRLYGTDLIVKSPKMLQGKGKVNIILKAGGYNDEIKKDILENINDQVTFW